MSSSTPDSMILDPFDGSGSTFAVAEAPGRKWMGSELNEEYCNVIQNRVSNHQHIKRIATAVDEQESQNRRKMLRG